MVDRQRLTAWWFAALILFAAPAVRAADAEPPLDWFAGTAAEQAYRRSAVAIMALARSELHTARLSALSAYLEAVPAKGDAQALALLDQVLAAKPWVDAPGPLAPHLHRAVLDAWTRSAPGRSAFDLLRPAYGRDLAISILDRLPREIVGDDLRRLVARLETATGSLDSQDDLLWCHEVAHSLAQRERPPLSDGECQRLRTLGGDLLRFVIHLYHSEVTQGCQPSEARYFWDKYGKTPIFANLFLTYELIQAKDMTPLVNDIVDSILRAPTTTLGETVLYTVLKHLPIELMDERAIALIQQVNVRTAPLPETVTASALDPAIGVAYHILLNRTASAKVIAALKAAGRLKP